MIFGTQGDRGGVIVSAGVRNQGRITVADRYNRLADLQLQVRVSQDASTRLVGPRSFGPTMGLIQVR
jgi:hypothetical protein